MVFCDLWNRADRTLNMFHDARMACEVPNVDYIARGSLSVAGATTSITFPLLSPG
jgi:hypothetical protein